MIRLLVHDTRGPPLRLRLLRVARSARSRAWWSLASIVRVSHLLARLNELDKRLGDHAAVELLEVLEGTLVVTHHLLGISNAERHHLVGPNGGVVVTV